MTMAAASASSSYPLPPMTYEARKPVAIRSSTPRKIDLADLTPNNIGQLRKLNSVLFPVRFGEKWYKDVLSEDAREVCKFGNICCRFDREGKDGVRLYIMTLGCLAPYRRLGIASKLLTDILEVAGPGKMVSILDLNAATPKPKKNKEGKEVPQEAIKEKRIVISVYLHVQTSNGEAKAFYEKHGFTETQTLPEYYKMGIQPRSAWLLEKRQKQ